MIGPGPRVYVSGCFDDLRLQDMLFLQAAAEKGSVKVFLWNDRLCEQQTGKPPRFPQQERAYFLQAVRYVDQVEMREDWTEPDELPTGTSAGGTWFVRPGETNPRREEFSRQLGLDLCVDEQVSPEIPLLTVDPLTPPSGQKKVLVTGSFDWLHSGHVRFFEQCAAFGDLYVIVGHDANIHLLKGEGHPMFPEKVRLFMVQSIRYVQRALISSGHGWMDAAPEIEVIQPDIYIVNQDGDVEEKRVFCNERGIEYRVLERLPKPGLPKRHSTELRRSLADAKDGMKEEKC